MKQRLRIAKWRVLGWLGLANYRVSIQMYRGYGLDLTLGIFPTMNGAREWVYRKYHKRGLDMPSKNSSWVFCPLTINNEKYAIHIERIN